MAKIIGLLKLIFSHMLRWLGKTVSHLAFYVYYYLVKRTLVQKIISQKKYLILPTLSAIVIFLALSETLFAFQGEPMRSPILLAKITQPEERLISEDKITDQRTINNDYTIAATDDNVDYLNDPATALGGAALVSPDIILEDTPVMRTDIETYVVQPGDTIESIALKFAISIKSVLWENKLTATSVIRPGQKLTILPVDGVTHKVLTGETIDKIAKYYKASTEDIVDFNNLADATDIHKGDILMIPEGQLPPPPAPRRTVTPKDQTTLAQKTTQMAAPEGESCHVFVPGQCTWYVGRKRCIPWAGHAKYWISNARHAGFTIGKTPAVGAVIALNESWYGHVAYVESFTDTTVTFTEMNHVGPWIIDTRTLNLNDRRIVGYIY
ncbi:MAG: LysM peptidoglycan-binding domain-containing protein [Patescibacteria group bacterium]|nr:LysM peptidoglycan-binding domain-containing protein [Patescibacteria group bacterium]MDD5222142.1 LysM peptidoglycan-binding domain-containing protein [Patescibacteria group bacterium]MDD5396413.1 LysM peptidoglycan-binding domain-containing protein [Patescibacteria group bacterium]